MWHTGVSSGLKECSICGFEWDDEQVEDDVCIECRDLSHFERAWLAATRDLTAAIVKFDETLKTANYRTGWTDFTKTGPETEGRTRQGD